MLLGIAFSNLAFALTAPPCPEKVGEWKERRADWALWLSYSGAGFDEATSACWKRWESAIRANEKLSACLAPFNEMYKISKLNHSPGGKRALVSTTEQYHQDAEPFVRALPDLSSKDFLDALARDDQKAAEAYLDKVNVSRKREGKPALVYAVYVPNQGAPPAPNQHHEMFTIYEPSTTDTPPRTERWYNLATGKNPGQYSVVATHYPEKGPPVSYFADHGRSYSDEGAKLETSRERNPDMNCLQCHLSGGPIALHPPKAVDPKYANALSTINASIANVPISFSSHWGDNVGQSGRLPIPPEIIPEEYWRKCISDGAEWKANEIPKDSITRVAAAANCMLCHDGKDRSLFRESGTLVREFIDRGAMPPGVELSKQERAGLATCMLRYFSREFRDDKGVEDGTHVLGMAYYYLMSGDCDDKPAAKAAPKRPAHTR